MSVCTIDGHLGREKYHPALNAVKWLNIKHGYGFINRNNTRETIFLRQATITRNNPHKIKRSVGEDETVEFDVIASEKGRAANVTRPETTTLITHEHTRTI